MSFRPAAAAAPPAPRPTGRQEAQGAPSNLLKEVVAPPVEKKQAKAEPEDERKRRGWRPWPQGLGAPQPESVFDADASDAAWAQIRAHQLAAVEVVRRTIGRVHHRLEAVRPMTFVPAIKPNDYPLVGGSDAEMQADFSGLCRTSTFFEPFPSTPEGEADPNDPEADTWNERAARCAFVAAIELDGPALLTLIRGFPEVMEVRGVGYQAPRRRSWMQQCEARVERERNVTGPAAGWFCAVQAAMQSAGVEPPPDEPVFGGASVHGCSVLFTLMQRAYAERTDLDEDALCGHSAVQLMVQSVYEAYVEATKLRYTWVGRAWDDERTEVAVTLPVLEAGCDPFELPIKPEEPLAAQLEVAAGAGDAPLKLAVQHDDMPTARYLLAKLAPLLCQRAVNAERLAS